MKITNDSVGAFRSFYRQRQEIKNKTEVKKENKDRQISKVAVAVAAASLIGATVPLAIYNAKKGKLDNFKDVFQKKSSPLKEKVKAATGFLEVKGIEQIGLSVTGSIFGGLGAGLLTEKDEKSRTSKIKEGIYGFLNCMVPIGIIAGAERIIEKKNIKTNILGKAAVVAGGIVSGMFISNKLANGINKNFISKDKENYKEREIKLSDTIVHADDIIGVIAMSKVPYAKHIGKVIPVIYSHVGYETGTKTSDKN